MVSARKRNLTNLFLHRLDAGNFKRFPAPTVQSNVNYVIACDPFEFERGFRRRARRKEKQ